MPRAGVLGQVDRVAGSDRPAVIVLSVVDAGALKAPRNSPVPKVCPPRVRPK